MSATSELSRNWLSTISDCGALSPKMFWPVMHERAAVDAPRAAWLPSITRCSTVTLLVALTSSTPHGS
ncbi:MAG TPA: hypothetical protein VN654_27765 [Vicinamibacterales bacterium]|nr:hypothetical protein [Vicinamibacterales bacterium]